LKIKRLAKIELSELDMLCELLQREVERVVSKLRKEKFRFFNLPQNERYRLLKLRNWQEMYSVDLNYILGKLLPLWESWLPKKSKRSIHGYGLGIRLATLTGKKSEQMLQEFIKQDFPSEQNKTMRRSYKQDVILKKYLSEDGIRTESKTLLDFGHPKGYLQYYRKRMQRQNARIDKITQEFQKRPYRGNPFC